MSGLKRICIGVLAVGALAVALGVGTASADSLCKANENPCSEANRLPESAELVRSEALEFCPTSCVEATVVWQESTVEDVGPSEGLKGTIEAASFTGVKGLCKEISAVNLPWSTEWSASVQRLFYGSGGSGNPGISLGGCYGAKVECQYGISEVSLWAVVGGNPLAIHEFGDGWSKTGGSPLCAAIGTWHTEGELTEPTGLIHLVGSP